MEFAFTLVQMSCYEGHRERNFDLARMMLEERRPDRNKEFILLPELFAIGFRHSDYDRLGAGIPGPTSEFIEELAEEQSAYVAGTGIEKAGKKWYNTLVMASPDGRILAHYRKIHPFQEEKDTFTGGDRLAMVEAGGIKIGLQICYDIRFPEVSRKLALEGAEILIFPAAFPDPRSAHWDSLVQARAIENQVYVAAANRVGAAFDDKIYFGHSHVVDPWGVRLLRLNSEEGVKTTTGDTAMIPSVREQITCYQDRAPQSYEEIEYFNE
ncbi:carbon-nitrogen family hydrolase [Candidatus Thorarchaeota archaeon]|nr:MAG: carbon-nitrogen family hydrolase [Candidatus Thorarchaeota archaeon]